MGEGTIIVGLCMTEKKAKYVSVICLVLLQGTANGGDYLSAEELHGMYCHRIHKRDVGSRPSVMARRRCLVCLVLTGVSPG